MALPCSRVEIIQQRGYASLKIARALGIKSLGVFQHGANGQRMTSIRPLLQKLCLDPTFEFTGSLNNAITKPSCDARFYHLYGDVCGGSNGETTTSIRVLHRTELAILNCTGTSGRRTRVATYFRSVTEEQASA